MRELTYTRVLTADSSFQLVRTNPKLTGNIKITVNEAGELWLNSIKANTELSKDDYSRFPIDVTQSLASNIYRFFKNGATPNEIIFGVSEKVDLTKTSKDFKDQYDFSNYFSGAKYFPSNKYSEKFSYFAPLYLNKELPRYFVIFKIKDPLNSKIDVSKQNFENGSPTSEYMIDLFKKATIIKTFDLSEDSKPGKFIRDYLRSPNFPAGPLTASFGEEEYTTWNGILIDSGIMGSRGELLYDQYLRSTPLKFFEENITKGFERNGVIFPNILNLEFIFDDPTSKKYEINRYLGLYLNTIELSKLDIDLARGYSERGTWENTPRFRQPYYEYQETILEQENPNGVIVPYSGIDLNVSEFTPIFTNAETLYFNYLTDKFNRLHLPKLSGPYDVSLSQEVVVSLEVTDISLGSSEITATSVIGHGYATDDLIFIETGDPDFDGSHLITRISETQFKYTVELTGLNPTAAGLALKETDSGKIRLSDEKIDLGHFFGPSLDTFLQDTGFVSYVPGRSYSVITVGSNPKHADEIRLYHPNGTRLDANGKYDLLTATEDYSLIPDDGDYYFFNDYDGVTGYDVFYFSVTGRANQIASAIAGCINNIRNRTFTAYAYNEHVFIICNSPGEFDELHKISFVSPQEEYGSLSIDGVPVSEIIGSTKDFRGGSKPVGNRLVVDRLHFDKISGEINDLLVKTKKGWAKIKKLSNYVDLITESNAVDPATRIEAIGEYLDKIVVTLEQADEPTIAYTNFTIKRKFRPGFGLISLFPIKDLDFDFYSSDYLNFPEIDLYQNHFVPPGVEVLVPGLEYKVSECIIDVDGVQYSDGDTFTVAQRTSYSFVSGSADRRVVYYYSGTATGDSLTVPIQDGNKELLDFPGFSILKDPQKVVPQNDSLGYSLRSKYTNGLTSTEYDFYKENESSDFALRSKVIPYITKWGIKGGFDSRDNPYRLNTEIVFGRNNFSPDHSDQTQNPDNFTHEWFYIESKFNYLNDPEISKKNGYYFDTPLDIDRLISEPDYFLEYFTYTPAFGTNEFGENVDIAPTQFRYSTLFKNRAGEYETFFKGFKVSFRDVTDPNTLGPDGKPIAKQNSSRFEGYKFSCVLKPIKEVSLDPTQPPIRYRVIEHTDFKFIVVVIELSIGNIAEVGDYWKTVPFSGSFTKIGREPVGSAEEVFFADPNYPTELDSSLPYETIFGDYRIGFDQVNGEDISNLSHVLLYSLKHKKFNSLLDNFANVKLSSKLSVYDTGIAVVPGTNDTQGSISLLRNLSISNYPASLSDEIVLPRDLNLVGLFNTGSGSTYFLDQRDVVSFSPRNINPINRAIDLFAEYRVLDGSELFLTVPVSSFPYTSGFQSPLNLSGSVFEQVMQDSFCFFVIAGGEKYFERLLEKLSFSKFKKYVNSLDPIIEYSSYSISQTGAPIASSSPNFYLDLPDQSEIDKVNQVIAVVDEDRPSQFSFVPVISYKYEVGASANAPELNRYRGDYEPIVKDVLHCRSNFKFTKNRLGDLNLSNTKLNTYISTLFTLPNFNHIKVADTKVLELESDPAYLPVYPTIGEVAIGQNPMFLLSSNWDWGFHQRYSSATAFSPVSGAIRVEEDECFLGKVISLRDEIELESFEVQLLTETQQLEDVDLSQVEIVAKETANSLDGFINLNNVLTRYLILDGISAKFNEFLINSYEYIGNFDSIESYVREYIRLNVLRLYDVNAVEFFSRKNPALSAAQGALGANGVQFVFLNDQDRFKLGYSNLKNVRINKPEKLILNFRIQKQLDSGLDISPKVKIKFI
jgi:hypothetical protein